MTTDEFEKINTEGSCDARNNYLKEEDCRGDVDIDPDYIEGFMPM